MQDTFDPYREWLGIETAARPLDHYTLLGLERFESDPELIARSADMAMAQVRRLRPGPHLAQWSRLLDELSKAKACLLDPASRRAYDTVLSQPPEACIKEDLSEPAFTPAPEIVQTPAEQFEPFFTTLPEKPVVVRRSSGMGAVLTVLVVLAIAAGGFLVHTIRQQDTPTVAGENSSPKPKPLVETPKPVPKWAEPTKPPPPPLPTPVKKSPADSPVIESNPQPPPEPEALALAEEQDVPSGESNETKPKEEQKPAIDAARAAAFTQAVADVRLAFADRDLPTAAAHLKTAADNTQTQEDNDQIDRLQTMLENLTQFWNGIQTSMSKLQPTDELPVGDTRIIVIESDRDQLKVKHAGRVRTYKSQTLPTPLVMALADHFFGKDPGSKAIIGTFLAVDPHGDRALAKEYWQTAAEAGIDTQKLLIEITDPTGRGASATKIDPPTDKAQLDAAEQLIKEKYAAEFAKAVNSSGRLQLARDLIAAAQKEGAEARFVMLRQAKELAVATGQAALACEAIDQLSRSFNIDPINLKADVIEASVEHSRGLSTQRDLVLTALKLVDQAIEDQRIEEAGRLAAAALQAARKSKNVALLRQATAIHQQLQTMRNNNKKAK